MSESHYDALTPHVQKSPTKRCFQIALEKKPAGNEQTLADPVSGLCQRLRVLSFCLKIARKEQEGYAGTG